MAKLIDINVGSKNPTMKFNLDVPAVTVRSRIRLTLAELNLDADQPVALVAIIDESGSTMMDDFRLKDGSFIFPVEISAAKQLVYLMGEKDKLAIVTFSNGARTIMELTNCNAAGRDQLIAALDSIRPNKGGTNYEAGLQLAHTLLQHVTGMTRAIAFQTDGTRDSNSNPFPIASQILQEGIVLCTAAISESLKAGDEADLKTMSGGANFRPCNNADDVAAFLSGALRKAKKAAISNTTLNFTAIGMVDNIKAFDRVLKTGNRNFVAGSITQKSGNNPASATVEIGEIGPHENVDVYIEFQLKPIKAPQGKTFQERTFGGLTVTGQSASQGITTPVTIGDKEMFQNFALTTSGQVVSEIEKFEAEWTAASAIAAAAASNNAQQQQDILNQAAAKVRRATAVFVDDVNLAGSLSTLEELAEQSRKQGAAAAGKSAGRKTAVFVDED